MYWVSVACLYLLVCLQLSSDIKVVAEDKHSYQPEAALATCWNFSLPLFQDLA